MLDDIIGKLSAERESATSAPLKSKVLLAAFEWPDLLAWIRAGGVDSRIVLDF